MYKNAGEWVNKWNVNGSQTDYQDFGRAQLEVYNAASFGWAYWTLKNDRKHWDFGWNVVHHAGEVGVMRCFLNSHSASSSSMVCRVCKMSQSGIVHQQPGNEG
ncbi:hypothetical protein SASPL_135441 [Salvia splendens]|uniref:Uncharacterized protein n=1 Tax=Salvia splendens TaxID=180675 RepID=A0A8X8WZM3_SALSN|nr:hypothetical protein SASPL_135441 [Salvia splendens]